MKTVAIDFETYSEAGYRWDAENREWRFLAGLRNCGLKAVGLAVYATHASTEILSVAYQLPGKDVEIWVPGEPPPAPLLSHVAGGGLLSAWNSAFEYYIWRHVACKKLGWPPLQLTQMRCTMARARAFGLPGSLEKCGEVLNLSVQKDKRGKALLDKFSLPHIPTVKNPALRHHPRDYPEDALALYEYNKQDVRAEVAISNIIPPLVPGELKFWLADQAINLRGVGVDTQGVKNGIKLLEQLYAYYDEGIHVFTDGMVKTVSQLPALKKWMSQHVPANQVKTLSVDDITYWLEREDTPSLVKAVLRIRQAASSASVKKLYSMLYRAESGRLQQLYHYYGAHTGRASGTAVQPQNLPGDPQLLLSRCECGGTYVNSLDRCPHCGIDQAFSKSVRWSPEAVEDALAVIAARDIEHLQKHYAQSGIKAISGCLRGLFVAAPGKVLVGADYSAIEAVILAAMAQEKWRLEVFRTHGGIYEASAALISGTPVQEILAHQVKYGTPHPLRKLGKVAELASGYQGGVGAWREFGADELMSDLQIKEAVKAWRTASPNIVKLWYSMQDAAIAAVSDPGLETACSIVKYVTFNDVLYCKLPSGRSLVYQRPRIEPSDFGFKLSYETWNTNPKYGKTGWVRLHTYGGKLVQNIDQALARDILAHAILNLEAAKIPVVLHTYDETACEIIDNPLSIQRFTHIMSTLPPWASDWPIKLSEPWVGKRYRK